MADDAIDFLNRLNQIDPDKPFFVKYAPGATHAPHHPTKEWVEKISAMKLFDDVYEKLRERIFENQKRLGVIPASTHLEPWPNDVLKPWDELTADAMQVNARGVILQDDVADLDLRDLGDARTGVVEQLEQQVIALADPGRRWCIHHGEHLLGGQITEHGALETLDGDAERAFNDLERRHVPATGKLQERPQCRQACVRAADAVVTLLEMIEECHDQLRRNLPECHLHRRFAELGLSELEEEHQGIAVGGDGLWAQRALLGQILDEVGLHEGRE
jgi:hypothetical protein